MSWSSAGSRVGSSSTMVTSDPKALNIVAHSAPTALAPMTTMRRGTSGSRNAPSEVTTPGQVDPGDGQQRRGGAGGHDQAASLQPGLAAARRGPGGAL